MKGGDDCAFPFFRATGDCSGHPGLTIREYMAMHLLEGMLAGKRGERDLTYQRVDEWNASITREAVRLADALIHALNEADAGATE